MLDKYKFEYCQKLVIFSKDHTEVLLGKRKGEDDYDGTYSFFGGKMEHSDGAIGAGIAREKREELGSQCSIDVYLSYSTNLLFRKKNGAFMIIPHYYAEFKGGEIQLSDEYSQYKWVRVDRLATLKQIIPTIPEVVKAMLDLSRLVDNRSLIRI